MCICKQCILEFIGNKGSIGYLDRIKLILGVMDKPFIPELWETSEEDWSKYIPQISSLPNYKGLSFADSQFLISKVGLEKKDCEYTEEQLQITEKDMDIFRLHWGKGYELEDYLYLENEYETLINSYESDSYAQQMLFQEIAHKRLEIQKKREQNNSTEKEVKTLQELLGSSNIKPVQETGANAAEQATFGTLIKKYENEHPIPEPDPAWKDVDGIKKYISIWFLGHLCRMLGINNDYSQMYDDEIAKYKVEAPEYEEEDEGVV